MIGIAVETPLQDEVRVLVAELNETLLAPTPPEFSFPDSRYSVFYEKRLVE